MVELFILLLFISLSTVVIYFSHKSIKVPVIKAQEKKIELPIGHENFSEEMMKAYIAYKLAQEEQTADED